ncbi:hypothetical protein NDU88_000870 [Pleurodeles waltl]|uniref:Uncharacterized protein n=1 Tax=Pleurodeles waltl TaxID=8319 RepID=A0AAV7VXU5_PLEWA|nr:hypothetical protein NDU88_000870 [Pleurodeles waltl]
MMAPGGGQPKNREGQEGRATQRAGSPALGLASGRRGFRRPAGEESGKENEPSSPVGMEALGSSDGAGTGNPKMRLAPDPGVRRSGCVAGRRLEPEARLRQIL